MADHHNRAIEDGLIKTLTWMRVKAELSQQDVAEQLRVSRVSVWNWENAWRFPQSLATLRRWTGAVDAKLEIKIVAKNGEEFLF